MSHVNFEIAFKSPRTREGKDSALSHRGLDVRARSCLPRVLPDLQAERVNMSSHWEETTLPLNIQEVDRATSG